MACCLVRYAVYWVSYIQDVMERTERLVKPTNYYPFLLIHVGINYLVWHSLECIRSVYVVLDKKVKDLGKQIVFLSVIPLENCGLGREKRMLEINYWLCRWCDQEKFVAHGLHL